MIYLSNNSNELWNNIDSNTAFFLYGAGTNAEGIIELLEKADIKIDGIIDKNQDKWNHYFNKYLIYPINTVKEIFKDKIIKIFITVNDVYGAIMYLEEQFDNVQIFNPPIEAEGGGINTFLAPVRNKLIKNKNFTLIANTCAGARLYQLTNCKYQSPFIGVIIKPDDYLKICSDLKNYLEYDLEFINCEEWKYDNKYHTLCRLKDAEIKFIGQPDFEKVKENWEKRIKRINWDNLFFIWENTHYSASGYHCDKFIEIPIGKKLILQRHNYYFNKYTKCTFPDVNLFSGFLVEKWFNIANFLNHEEVY